MRHNIAVLLSVMVPLESYNRQGIKVSFVASNNSKALGLRLPKCEYTFYSWNNVLDLEKKY